MLKLTALMFAVLCFSGCATTQTERFNKLSLGMDKTDVIEEVGSPVRSFRANDEDIWIYKFHEDNSLEEREISFKDGYVTYLGDIRIRKAEKPPASQEEAKQRLEKALKPNKPKPANYKDLKDDGSY